MAGPGGTEVGRVSVKVVPDVDGFRDKVKRELQEVEKMSADVEVTLDLTKLKAQIEEIKVLLKSIGDETVNVNVNKNSGIGNIAADTKKAAAESKKLAASLKEALGDGDQHNLSRFSRAMESFGETIGKVGQGVLSLGTQIGSGLGDAFKSVGGSLASMVVQLVIWVPLITGIIGLVTFLVGFLAAGLLTLPALLFGVVGPLAAIVLGFDGIKKAAKTLQPEIDKLKTRLSNTFAKELKPMFDSIKKIFPAISDGLNTIAIGVSKFVTALSTVFTSANGVKLLAEAFKNVNLFLQAMLPGVQRFLEVMLKVGAIPEIFGVLGGAISDVFEQITKFFNLAVQDGSLVKGVQNFGIILNDLAALFSSLLTNSLKFFNGAAPGMSKFFQQLDAFFSKIDWEALGKAFGDIFGGLGDAIAAIPPGTIQLITEAFISLAESIGKLLSGKSLDVIIALFASFVVVVTFVIDIIDVLLESFAAIGDGLANVGEWFASLDLIEDGKRIFNGLWEGIKTKWNEIVEWFKDLPRKVGEFFQDAGEWLVEKGKEILDGLWDGLKAALLHVLDFFGLLPDKFKGAIPSPGEMLKGIGQSIMDGLINGFKSMLPSLGTVLSGIANFIVAHKGPPSKDKILLVNNGQLIMQGFIRGLEEGFQPVSGLLAGMTAEVGAAFSDPALVRSMSISGADISAVGTSQLQIAGEVDSNSLEGQIVDALSNWTIDGKGVSRMVNNTNTAQRRRG